MRRSPLALSAVGSCPGTVTLSVSGASANSRVTILAARGLGDVVMSSGPCPGVTLGLDAQRRLATMTTDENGAGSIDRTTNTGQCGAFIQALDSTTCALSEVDQLP